ncbi:S10 family peptidase [Rhodoplanes azumiensis]|uniref:S10 family peptidase n=1 Tax=Rhodoplanes azumiensis TaxID=1897628 RepID=A0ABW5AGZ3_9BRAD
MTRPLPRLPARNLERANLAIAAVLAALVVVGSGAATPAQEAERADGRVGLREGGRAPDGRVQHGERPGGQAESRPAESRPGGDTAPRTEGRADARPDSRPERDASVRRLPTDSTTEHTLDLGGRTLRFRATAGSIPLFEGEGGPLRAEVGYVAFTMAPPAGTPAGARPLTFLFNGGPGAASAYLNIGAVGPWRLPLDGASVSTPPALVPNAETWLDFTDLVFVDPPGTGFSRIVGGEPARKQFWSVDGDAEALAVVLRKWIDQTGRRSAPTFLVGESYGGFRVPKLARALASDQGVGVRGLVLISPVLDFATLAQRRHLPATWTYALPSMAAAALEARGTFSPAALAEAEHYAATDYLADLLKGERDGEAVERLSARVAALTGLDPALVRRLAGRIDTRTFQRELFRHQGLVGSAYDATVTAFDPSPSAARTQFPDPVLDSTKAPLTAAITALYRGPLKWSHDQPYQLLSGEVNGQWNWGRGRAPPDVVDEVRTILSADRAARILVVHGASDLVTPYFATKQILGQLPVYGEADRLALKVYRGGHMFYSEDVSRKAFRQDAEAFFRAALGAGSK